MKNITFIPLCFNFSENYTYYHFLKFSVFFQTTCYVYYIFNLKTQSLHSGSFLHTASGTDYNLQVLTASLLKQLYMSLSCAMSILLSATRCPIFIFNFLPIPITCNNKY